MRRAATGSLAILLVASFAARAEVVDYRIVDSRSTDGIERRKVEQVVVLAISADNGLRHPVEDKLVSFLRGQEVGGVASYRVVGDLAAPPSRESIVRFLDEQRADSVITLRPMAFDEKQDAEWGESWNAWASQPTTVKALVEQSLPAKPGKPKYYGVELALWDAKTGARLWTARTAIHERKALRKNLGELILDTLQVLRDARWL